MNPYRKFITSTVGFAFVVVAATGVIFKFFFKNHVLEGIHGWLGITMVVAGSFHIFQNWGQLRGHFRDRRVFGLLVPILAVIALITFAPEEEKRGVNPREVMRKLSQGSASAVAGAFGKDVNAVFASMKEDGIQASNAEESIASLAQENHKQVETLFAYFLKDSRPRQSRGAE